MASARLVIASHVDGIQEIIEHQKTGLFFEVHNEEALREQLQWVLKNASKAEAMACAGRQAAEERYSIATMVAAYETVYESVLGDKD